MNKSMLITMLCFVLLFSSCALFPNRDPNILSRPKYSRIKTVQEVDSSMTFINTIEVVTRGAFANIKNSMPQLYDRALKESGDFDKQKPVYLTNITINSYSQNEMENVPYQECRTEQGMVSVPFQQCYGYGTTRSCSTSYRMESRPKYICQTKYRKEMVDVPYQQVKADLYK